MIIEHYSKKYNHIKLPFKPLTSLLINSKKNQKNRRQKNQRYFSRKWGKHLVLVLYLQKSAF